MLGFRSFIYDSRKSVHAALRIVNIIATFAALILIIYEIGFPMDRERLDLIEIGFDILFGLYALGYFVRVFFTLKRWSFIKGTWLEFVLMTIILVVGVSNTFIEGNVFQYLFPGVQAEKSQDIYTILISLYLAYIVGLQVVKASAYINILALKPATTFIFSFVLLITAGTGFLMLPEMSTQAGGADFMSAFFTSTSASCVTGLIVVDTATYWTFKGHLVIMFLMQFGGIGIVSFATFFATFLKRGVGIKQQVIIQDFLASESLFSAKGLLRQVIVITLIIESMAAILLFFTWGGLMEFSGVGEKVFYSIFHAVSAFCNAGFSLFSNGLMDERIIGSQIFHMVIAVTIIVGGLGFSTILDVFSPKALRERLEKPWKDWKLSSKIAIHTSLGLIVLGMVVILGLESSNGKTFGEMGNFERLIHSFFQSVTTRTAGFNTVDFGSMKHSTILFTIILMFIGASSGSTGGGIKTSTFVLITVSSIATIRGKKQVDLGGRTIGAELISKAFFILSFAAFYNLVMIFILTITDPQLPILELAFEEVSAFATVGLSTGITADFSIAGQCILIFTMFVGRIGTLTLALALSSRVTCNAFTYPTAHLMVG